MNDYQIVLTTCPDEVVAEKIARALVEDGLAACVNILSIDLSVYRWHNNIESEPEKLLIIKGRVTDYESIEEEIQRLHPYELPEVITVPITGGSQAYLAWLNQAD
jgi:periplasmic divalent cation tolerance protein